MSVTNVVVEPAAEPVLTAEQRARLAVFADALIGGGVGMPSASGAEVHSRWIDRVFAARPDMEATVREVLASEGDPAGVLGGLRADQPDRFASFAFAIAGAYLINPRSGVSTLVPLGLGVPGCCARRGVTPQDAVARDHLRHLNGKPIPRIRRELGYPGPLPMKQPALPDEAEAYLEDGILDVVIARGPIYRPTPASQ